MTRDLRRYAKQTNIRLFIGFFILLFVVGAGLIYWFYGREAAILGSICIVAGLIPLGLVWGLLAFLGWIVKRYNGDE